MIWAVKERRYKGKEGWNLVVKVEGREWGMGDVTIQ